MRIIAIGDIHAHTTWKDIIEKELQNSDKIVFIGDYFDTFQLITSKQQVEIFLDLLKLRKENPDKIVLLLGNHDHHYIKHIKSTCSGFNPNLKVLVQDILTDAINEGLVQLCYKFDNFLFTHAGVTKTWIRKLLKDGILTELHFEPENIDTTLNDLLINSPRVFGFTIGPNLCNYGDDITQSPIWVRPKSLSEDCIPNFIQIVGHTPQDKLVIYETQILIDTMKNGEYLIIESNEDANILSVGILNNKL